MTISRSDPQIRVTQNLLRVRFYDHVWFNRKRDGRYKINHILSSGRAAMYETRNRLRFVSIVKDYGDRPNSAAFVRNAIDRPVQPIPWRPRGLPGVPKNWRYSE